MIITITITSVIVITIIIVTIVIAIIVASGLGRVVLGGSGRGKDVGSFGLLCVVNGLTYMFCRVAF